jgi:hypothetical protein
MPLLAPVIRAARQRRTQLQASLGVAQLAAWRSMLAPRWLRLPAPIAGPRERTVDVAVDGTSHSVQLHNGAHFILAVAAAHGPDYCRDERADMEILPARYDDAQASSARDLLMRSLEAFTATQAAACLSDRGEARRGVLWVDGSLFADLAHMAGAPEKVRWGAGIERAGRLLETPRRALLARRAVRSVGSRDRKDSTRRLSVRRAHLGHPGDTDLGRDGGGRRAAGGRGAAGHDADRLELAGDPRRPALPTDQRPGARPLGACPAIVSTYVRPHAADLPLRIDVPVSALGLDDRLLPAQSEAARAWPAWLPDPELMRPVVQTALAAYGGMNVYNAPLYAVDRLVRLPRRELELRFLPVCEKVAGLQPGSLNINRGRRRFLMA